jgi:hypothetical protein
MSKAIKCPMCHKSTLSATRTERIQLVDADGTLAYKYANAKERSGVHVFCTACGWSHTGWEEFAKMLGLKVATK